MADKPAHDVRIGTSGWNYPLAGYEAVDRRVLSAEARPEDP